MDIVMGAIEKELNDLEIEKKKLDKRIYVLERAKRMVESRKLLAHIITEYKPKFCIDNDCKQLTTFFCTDRHDEMFSIETTDFETLLTDNEIKITMYVDHRGRGGNAKIAIRYGSNLTELVALVKEFRISLEPTQKKINEEKNRIDKIQEILDIVMGAKTPG